MTKSVAGGDARADFFNIVKRASADEPTIITLDGVARAAVVSVNALERLNMLTAFEIQQSQDAAATELGLRALQLAGGEFDAAMALLNRAALALYTEKERQRRAAKQTAMEE